MKRAILNIVLLVLSVTSLPAQTIAGTWQGILSPPNGSTLRLVCAIEKNPDGSLHGSLNNIDGGGSLLLSSVTFAAPDVTFAASAAALTFRGKLVDDGQSIAGSFTQGNQSLPLTLRLATPETLWRPQGAGLPPMAANADPTFEVATIKPCEQQAEHNVSVNLTGRPFTAKSASAKELIKIAWDLRGRQVLGGPSWFEDIKYDVTGQPDTPGRPSPEQARSMVRKLLVERFHLVSHTAEQSYPIIALTLDPKGPPPTHSDPSHNLNGNVVSHMDGGDVIYQVSGTTMQQFLGLVMNLFQDKQLVDETGLTGAYDITLRIPASAFDTPFDRSLNDERGTAIINAVQQAGFKFVSKKGSLPVVIVDSIDPPTPN